MRATGGTWTAGNYRFTGAELDSATGLYHMGARFYDPAIGGWLSEDPVQDNTFNVASLNFYAYVYNNPILNIDDDGRVPKSGVPGFDVGEGCGICGPAILPGVSIKVLEAAARAAAKAADAAERAKAGFARIGAEAEAAFRAVLQGAGHRVAHHPYRWTDQGGRFVDFAVQRGGNITLKIELKVGRYVSYSGLVVKQVTKDGLILSTRGDTVWVILGRADPELLDADFNRGIAVIELGLR